MHVGLYSPAWPPAEFSNGVVTYVHWIRQELTRRGHRVSVFAGRLGRGGESVGIHLVDARSGSRLARLWGRAFGGRRSSVFGFGDVLADRVLSVHRRDPIDVFEMEESFGWAASLIQARRFPVVVKLHGPAFLSLVDEELQGDLAEQKIAAEGRALALAPFVVSPARHTLVDTLARYRLAPRISAHIGNPVALDAHAALWNAAACEPHTVLFVGRFDKRKGGDRVLRAFKRVLRTRPDARLVVIGPDPGLTRADGPPIHLDAYADTLFTPAERERIRYLGSQPLGAVSAWRARAAVTVVAARWENLAYAALEAMLQGCPLVSADNAGSLESVRHGETGLICRGDDADDMAAQILLLMDQPELAARLGARAREHVLAAHGMTRILDETTKVYRAAVAEFAAPGVNRAAA